MTSSVMSSAKISVIRPAELDLVPVEGNPLLRMSANWTSDDGSRLVGAFGVSAGADFEFEQTLTEAMYITSGRITYTTPDGTNYDLKAGDFVQIDAGTSIKVKSEEDSAGFFIMLQ
jgi:uncharacterized cupin superfamily protein